MIRHHVISVVAIYKAISMIIPMGYQNKAQYNWMPLWRGPIYHYNEDSTVKTVAEYQSDLTLTTASPYLALSGEAWGVCCEDLGKYLPCSNSTILYVPISWDVLLHYYIACKTNISWYVYDNQLQWIFPSRKTTMTTRLLLWYTKLSSSVVSLIHAWCTVMRQQIT